MPIYEYECGACGETVEFIQKFGEASKRKCPECGRLKLKRLVSAAAFHLKGTGWYETDFKNKGKDKSADAKSDSSDSASSASSADSSKSDSKSDSKSSDKSNKSDKKSSSKSGDKAA